LAAADHFEAVEADFERCGDKGLACEASCHAQMYRDAAMAIVLGEEIGAT
jgi:hypothetical protein